MSARDDQEAGCARPIATADRVRDNELEVPRCVARLGESQSARCQAWRCLSVLAAGYPKLGLVRSSSMPPRSLRSRHRCLAGTLGWAHQADRCCLMLLRRTAAITARRRPARDRLGSSRIRAGKPIPSNPGHRLGATHRSPRTRRIVSRNARGATGFTRCSLNPASRLRATSWFIPYPETAMAFH